MLYLRWELYITCYFVYPCRFLDRDLIHKMVWKFGLNFWFKDFLTQTEFQLEHESEKIMCTIKQLN
ncbi:unknown protein [Oryza sativa Japonica Group]|uniref:Os01g0392600 protein n=1 Tax=Oryza sativa subsp. japonica TaxID=39947 RepID=Q5VNK4_ORYSJ|nr:unknown protein [Oryza sativa Japonica Group]BAH91094.1 Os01g0392600 [Oryza sativa Japonica Group]|eukprot:NP_001172364.1 Os01g0392600 [Oryza sativa Japonica Group]